MIESPAELMRNGLAREIVKDYYNNVDKRQNDIDMAYIIQDILITGAKVDPKKVLLSSYFIREDYDA